MPVSFIIVLAFSVLPVPRIEAAVIERKLKENANDPLDPQNIRDVQKTLIHAEMSNVNIRATTVRDAGKAFLHAATNDPENPDAWNATVAFVNYKSFLNAEASQKVKDVLPGVNVKTHYEESAPEGTTPAQFSIAGRVPKSEVAQFLILGQPDPDAGAAYGNDWIVVFNGAVSIDGMRLKKVIFRNDTIYYQGGPLEMTDVYFIRCTFEISPTPNSKRFVEAVLEPLPSVTFSTD